MTFNYFVFLLLLLIRSRIVETGAQSCKGCYKGEISESAEKASKQNNYKTNPPATEAAQCIKGGPNDT
jgi:hypothetical protein